MLSAPVKVIGMLLLILITTACSDGNGNQGSVTGDADSDPVLGVNRGLTGNVAMSFSNKLWKLDLFTGQISRYPRAELDQDPSFHNLASFALTPVRGEQGGFVMAVNNCYQSSGEYPACLVFMDADTKTTNTHKLGYNIVPLSNKISASADGKYVSVLYNPVIGETTIDTFEYPGGKLVAELDIGTRTGDVNFDWSPDQILYISRQDRPVAEILAWSPFSKEFLSTISVPFEGYIEEIAPSPDGLQIAFELRNFESSIYVVNVITLEFRRLVKADDSQPIQFFSNPEWSPDGQWILAEHHVDPDTGPDEINLIAIPSDAEDLVYKVGDTSPGAVPFAIVTNAIDVLGAASQFEWWSEDTNYWVSQ